jgi:hypothetical protein
MQINFGSAPRTIQCSLSNANFGVTFNAVSTPYTAIRPANGLAGSYTASLARSNAPATEGAAFALITNAPNGTVNIRSPSALADGTAFAKKSVLTEDARSPVYVPLYNNTGLLVGWLNFSNGTSGNTAGTLTWIKPAMPGSLLFPSGITSTLAVAGSPYQKPSLGDAPLAATNFSLQLAGGDLSSPLSIDMVLRTNLLSATASSIYKPTLKIDPATGAIGGGVTINGVSHLLHGAVLQNATNGGGFFVDPAHTGSLKLSPK